MTGEMELILQLCEKLGFEVEKKATRASIENRGLVMAMGSAFDPGLEYTYTLSNKEKG